MHLKFMSIITNTDWPIEIEIPEAINRGKINFMNIQTKNEFFAWSKKKRNQVSTWIHIVNTKCMGVFSFRD